MEHGHFERRCDRIRWRAAKTDEKSPLLDGLLFGHLWLALCLVPGRCLWAALQFTLAGYRDVGIGRSGNTGVVWNNVEVAEVLRSRQADRQRAMHFMRIRSYRKHQRRMPRMRNSRRADSFKLKPGTRRGRLSRSFDLARRLRTMPVNLSHGCFGTDMHLAALELDLAILECKERVIAPDAYVKAGMELGAALTNDDRPGGD
jgi:hypothetical protein